MWNQLLRVDWDRLTHAYGWACDVPDMLRRMVSHEKSISDEGWSRFWGAINHQGDFYDSTAAIVPFLIEAALNPQTPCRIAILHYFRSRWLEAPEYGGDPVLSEPPGGIDLPIPMRTDLDCSELTLEPVESIEKALDETTDEEFDIKSYRPMDLCAWQTGRAIQSGQSAFEALLSDSDLRVAAAAAALLMLWPDDRDDAKQTLIRCIEREFDPIERARCILEFGVYGVANEGTVFSAWVAPNQPAEVRAAAALAWAWAIDPDPLPDVATIALREASTSESNIFERIPQTGIYGQGAWMLPANAAELILRLACNQNREVRWRAVQGLEPRRFTARYLSAKQIVPVLIERLNDKYNRIRGDAAAALAERGESVVDVDSRLIPALIATLDGDGSARWDDDSPILDSDSDACGHAARLLAAIPHRLTPAQHNKALAGIERAAWRHTGHEDHYVRFSGMWAQAASFLKEQHTRLREGIEWTITNLLAEIAFPTKEDRRLPLVECDRRLADFYDRDRDRMIATAIKALRQPANRNVCIGAAAWLMTIGPAAQPALDSLDALTTFDDDRFLQDQARTTAKCVRWSLLIPSDPEAESSLRPDERSAAHRIASIRKSIEAEPTKAVRESAIAEIIGLLELPGALDNRSVAEILTILSPTAAEITQFVPALEMIVASNEAVRFGRLGEFELEGRLYHWRQVRRSARVAAIQAYQSLGRIPEGDGLLRAMLAESMQESVVCGDRVAPQRFPIAQWRTAVVAAGGQAFADPLIRATRQLCRRHAWTGDISDQIAFAADRELAEVIRRLSGRLV